jgi:DNA-binding response OmpR family regulator
MFARPVRRGVAIPLRRRKKLVDGSGTVRAPLPDFHIFITIGSPDQPSAGVASQAVSGSRSELDRAVPPNDTLRLANLEIRPGEKDVFVDGRRAGLTTREFQILHVLAERCDRVVTRPEIYDRVWGGQMAYRDRSVDVFVRKARRKLGNVAPNWIYIHTHFGVGYRFSPERVAR